MSEPSLCQDQIGQFPIFSGVKGRCYYPDCLRIPKVIHQKWRSIYAIQQKAIALVIIYI